MSADGTDHHQCDKKGNFKGYLPSSVFICSVTVWNMVMHRGYIYFNERVCIYQKQNGSGNILLFKFNLMFVLLFVPVSYVNFIIKLLFNIFRYQVYQGCTVFIQKNSIL